MMKKPERLRVMSWGGAWGRALAEHVSEPFSRMTGIRVDHAIHVGLELPPSLPYDVVWSNGIPAMQLDARGGCRTLAIAYAVHYVLAYRRAAFPGGPPDSYEVLLDPRHRKKIALYPGGNGFHAIAQVMGGGDIATMPDEMRACWSFIERLAPQIGALEYSIGMGAKLASGELDLAFRALPNAIAFHREETGVDWIVPREGATDTIDALWIPRAVPDQLAEWGERYIELALSAEVQERWCTALGVVPAHPDAAVPPHVRGSVLHLPYRMKAEHEPSWQKTFDAIVARKS